MRRNIILLGCFLGLIGLGFAIQHVWSERQKPIPLRPAQPTEVGEFRGISLQLHTGEEDYPYDRLIDEIAQTGANTVCIVVHGYQETITSTMIFIDSRHTPSDQHLGRLFDRAHEKGLRVMFMPIVLLAKPQGKNWRGAIEPSNHWNEWWKEYAAFILHYAKLAQKHDVELFSVGSELLKTEGQTDQWRQLIAAVRKAFDGRLTYSANWDHYDVPAWWRDLDIVGMTSYYTLDKGTSPKPENVRAAWADVRRKIEAWQQTVGRPILFTEVGWPNQVTAAEFPWNYYAAPKKPDPQQQAMLFEEFFRAWEDSPVVGGYIVWEWRHHPDQDVSPRSDTSYVPLGKPAMDVVQKYLLRRPATQPATGPAGDGGNDTEGTPTDGDS